MDSGEGRRSVEADIAYGESLKVRGTPTVFINGRKMDNAVTTENLKSEIENLGSN
jgi:protein-disulfide isomerase